MILCFLLAIGKLKFAKLFSMSSTPIVYGKMSIKTHMMCSTKRADRACVLPTGHDLSDASRVKQMSHYFSDASGRSKKDEPLYGSDVFRA